MLNLRLAFHPRYPPLHSSPICEKERDKISIPRRISIMRTCSWLTGGAYGPGRLIRNSVARRERLSRNETFTGPPQIALCIGNCPVNLAARNQLFSTFHVTPLLFARNSLLLFLYAPLFYGRRLLLPNVQFPLAIIGFGAVRNSHRSRLNSVNFFFHLHHHHQYLKNASFFIENGTGKKCKITHYCDNIAMNNRARKYSEFPLFEKWLKIPFFVDNSVSYMIAILGMLKDYYRSDKRLFGFPSGVRRDQIPTRILQSCSGPVVTVEICLSKVWQVYSV